MAPVKRHGKTRNGNEPSTGTVTGSRRQKSTLGAMVGDHDALISSADLRQQHMSKTDVLVRVKPAARWLPDGKHMTTAMVAEYYEVTIKTIESVVSRNRAELKSNGLRNATPSEFETFRLRVSNGRGGTRRTALFPSTAVLNVGMLLTESLIAELVRQLLIGIADEVARVGVYVDETNASDVQLVQAQDRITEIQTKRMEEKMDFKSILESLKDGGAESGDYARVQDHLYLRVFGSTAATIRRTRPQLIGDRKKDGTFTAASKSVAKNYLTAAELGLLDSVVLATYSQTRHRFPNGTPPEQMMRAIDGAVRFVMGPVAA